MKNSLNFDYNKQFESLYFKSQRAQNSYNEQK